MDQSEWRSRVEHAENLPDLLRRLFALQMADGAMLDDRGELERSFAFRGLGNFDWDLLTTLQLHSGESGKRALESQQQEYDRSKLLELEQRLLKQFRAGAWRFLGPLERRYAGIHEPDLIRAAQSAQQPPTIDDAAIWSLMAIARHHSVPTRLLDWTTNVMVAAYFAACDKPEKDGVIWWFDQTEMESALGTDNYAQWKAWDVPTRGPLCKDGERALELAAFGDAASPWISKIHHGLPFNRMQRQAGFFTACGQPDLIFNREMDRLGQGRIPRGRIVIPSGLKAPLLNHLERIGVHAATLDYPGADIVGARCRI